MSTVGDRDAARPDRLQADAPVGEAPATGPSDHKRAAIIQAARTAFLDDGFEAASMDRIAAAADVSKRTVYNRFESKEVLFAAVVRDLYSDLVEGVSFALDPEGDPMKVLSGFAKALVNDLSRPERQKLIRVVIAEARRFPEISALYFAEGKEPAVGRLAAWVESQMRAGRLAAPDPLLAAQQFLGMLKESAFWPLVLGLTPARSSEAVVDEAVRTFLARYACPGQAGESGA